MPLASADRSDGTRVLPAAPRLLPQAHSPQGTSAIPTQGPAGPEVLLVWVVWLYSQNFLWTLPRVSHLRVSPCCKRNGGGGRCWGAGRWASRSFPPSRHTLRSAEGCARGGPGLPGTAGGGGSCLEERANTEEPDAWRWAEVRSLSPAVWSEPVLGPLGTPLFICEGRQRGFLCSQRVCPGLASRCQQWLPPKGQGPASPHVRAVCVVVLVLVLVLVLSPGLLNFPFPGATAMAWLFAESAGEW